MRAVHSTVYRAAAYEVAQTLPDTRFCWAGVTRVCEVEALPFYRNMREHVQHPKPSPACRPRGALLDAASPHECAEMILGTASARSCSMCLKAQQHSRAGCIAESAACPLPLRCVPTFANFSQLLNRDRLYPAVLRAFARNSVRHQLASKSFKCCMLQELRLYAPTTRTQRRH